MRYTQPQGGPLRIDQTNPISNALTLLVSAGGSSTPFDLVRKRTSATNTTTSSASKVGLAYSNAASNAGIQLPGSTSLVTSDGNFTGAFSISVYANPASVASVQIVYGPMGGSAPESYFQFNGDRLSSSQAGTVSLNLPGGAGVFVTGKTDGNFHLYTAVRRGTSALEMWIDGVLIGTSSFSGAIATSARFDTLLGYFSGNFGCTFQTPLLFTHNRDLQPSEIASLAANPWQLFADDDTDWLKSSGVATPTAALAWLEQNDTTAISATYTAPLTASLAWTEANDTTAISATVTNASQLAWTETNDVTAITANVNTGGAVLNWTEQNDVAAISATVTNAGSLAWTEANDVTAITATVPQTVTAAANWTEQNDTCAIIAAAVVNGGLAWTEQNDVTSITAGTAQLVAAILAWVEQNDLAGYSSTGRAPLTPQILNQPFNNSLFLDGILNDRNTLRSGLDTVLPDQTVVNTMIVDKPIGLANQALLAIIPQV